MTDRQPPHLAVLRLEPPYCLHLAETVLPQQPPAGPLNLFECHESQLAEGRQRKKNGATGADRSSKESSFWKKEASLGEDPLAQFKTESWAESAEHSYVTTFANYTLKNGKPGTKSQKPVLLLPGFDA